MSTDIEPINLVIQPEINRTALNKIAEQISMYIVLYHIKPYTKEHKTMRKQCSDQLKTVPREKVADLAKILLNQYDLRLLSYELIYYYGFNNNC